MEEVSAHVHLGLIVPDILTRQHEHRSGLIWSGDHETCITDLQCRRFGCNLFQAYSITPFTVMSGNLIHVQYITPMWGSFRGCTTDRGSPSATTNLGLVVYSCIASSARSACSSRPSCSTWCYVVHII
ncbi:hypothetical protein M9H77_29488 [Catharanthus roseus]|uniref:Uncharacterized protein n=1 Tax=Catharanthus roseus TaxID=4058 RepID=A0ACB9ZUX2_CATRO|nr:hypothetical protein M9H77_29488 [Catharanthus roseus]